MIVLAVASSGIASLFLPADRTTHNKFVIPLELMENSMEIDTSKQEFNRWVLAVGDGTLPAKMKEGENEPTWIDIPEKFLIKTWDCPIRQIVEETYPDFTSRKTNNKYLK
ncbi:ATP-dependent DNA helicase PIF1-like protein [Tanacetum coccineum]|uniref:ATP-dependent DNA helicase n=1 Tax=Tanacetum coccineum TaxID=301880 RepID=A0ABQ4XP26_9ASTR